MSLAVTGTQWSDMLWKCPFTEALAKLSQLKPRKVNELADYDMILADHAPILGILLSEFRLFDPEPDADKAVRYNWKRIRDDAFNLAVGVLISKSSCLPNHPDITQGDTRHLIRSQSEVVLNAIAARLTKSTNTQHPGEPLLPGDSGVIGLISSHPALGNREYYALEGLAQWLIRWPNGVALESFPRGISQAVDALHRIVMDTERWPKDYEAEWLGFIMNELNLRLSSKARSGHSPPLSFYLSLIDAWVKVVHAMQTFDNVNLPLLTWKFHRHPFTSPGCLEPKTVLCGSLCRFYPVFMETLRLIREEFDRHRGTDALQWDSSLPLRLKITLTSEDRKMLGPSPRSTLEHRNEIRANISNKFSSLFTDTLPGM